MASWASDGCGAMATYQYRCRSDGVWDLSAPVGTAPATAACPTCGAGARRVFSPPSLALAPRALVRAVDRCEASRDAPDVVASPPPRGRRPRTATNPALRRLPRP